MKTINIKGKEYVPVVERVKEFHRIYGTGGNIETEIISNDDKRIIVKATITIPIISETIEGSSMPATVKLSSKFTGHSQAEWGKGMMGGVALEVAETSAVGRALGFANIGLIDGIASADEMRKVDGVKYVKKGGATVVDPTSLEDNPF
jgi:hypothetical protein